MNTTGKNETGNRYGRLLVIEEADRRGNSGEIYWLCLCECGNETIVRGSSLRDGSTLSCGCLRKERAKDASALPYGQAAFNQLYIGYKAGARTRGVSFSLTKEDFSFLTKMNCFYCGTPPKQVRYYHRYNGEYVYNGIDRIDNNKGYTLDNVVPCCGLCNWMKKDLSTTEFLEHISAIVNHRQLLEDKE